MNYGLRSPRTSFFISFLTLIPSVKTDAEPEFRGTDNSLCVTFPIETSVSVSPVTTGLNDRQEKVLEILHTFEKMSMREILERIEPAVSATALKRDLNLLKKKGLIKLKGRGRTSYWVVSGKNE